MESVVATFPSCSLDVSGGVSYELLVLIVEGGLGELSNGEKDCLGLIEESVFVDDGLVGVLVPKEPLGNV